MVAFLRQKFTIAVHFPIPKKIFIFFVFIIIFNNSFSQDSTSTDRTYLRQKAVKVFLDVPYGYSDYIKEEIPPFTGTPN